MKYVGFLIGIVLGIAFLLGFFMTDPAATAQGFSLRYFYLIMGLWFGSAAFLVLGICGFIKKRRQKQKMFFIQHGIKATATILSIVPTGLFVNRLPQYAFRLQLVSRDGRQMVVRVKKVVDFTDIDKLKLGLQIPAYVHPKKNKKFFVLWREAGIGQDKSKKRCPEQSRRVKR